MEALDGRDEQSNKRLRTHRDHQLLVVHWLLKRLEEPVLFDGLHAGKEDADGRTQPQKEGNGGR
jgi:hypothetical protein